MLGNKAVKAIILSSLLALAGMLPLHANAACELVS
ncbi:MAG: cytochrome C, partial [Methylophilaceae bacterium]|nr:cytochrome C [Methylophilaceae bacterium]